MSVRLEWEINEAESDDSSWTLAADPYQPGLAAQFPVAGRQANPGAERIWIPGYGVHPTVATSSTDRSSTWPSLVGRQRAPIYRPGQPYLWASLVLFAILIILIFAT